MAAIPKQKTQKELLLELRAAVSLAAKALERDDRPVRTEIARELRLSFGYLSDSM